MRRGCAAVLAAAATRLAALEAEAAAVPDSARLELLQSQLAAAPAVRVVARPGVFETSHPRVTDEGIIIPGPRGRASILSSYQLPSTDRHIAWPDIERVQTERSAVMKGVLIGALIGIAMTGVVAWSAKGLDAFEAGDQGVLIVGALLTVTTTGGGFLLGLTHPGLKTVHP